LCTCIYQWFPSFQLHPSLITPADREDKIDLTMHNVEGFAWGKCGGVVFERPLRLYLQTQSICHVVQPHFAAELGLELHRIRGLPTRSLDRLVRHVIATVWCAFGDVRITFAEMKHGKMCEFVLPIALVPGKAMCQFRLVYLGSGFFRKYASVGWVARGKTSFLDPTLGSYCFMHQFGTGQTILAAPGPDPTIPRSHVFNAHHAWLPHHAWPHHSR